MKWLFNPWLWIIIAIDILLSVNYKKWIGKAGEFMGCSNFPKCRFVKRG